MPESKYGLLRNKRVPNRGSTCFQRAAQDPSQDMFTGPSQGQRTVPLPAAKHVSFYSHSGVSCALKKQNRCGTEAVNKEFHAGVQLSRSLACNFLVLLTTRVTVMIYCRVLLDCSSPPADGRLNTAGMPGAKSFKDAH